LALLTLSHNQISDLGPLANLDSLVDLHLEDNDISDISPLLDNGGLRRNEVPQADNEYSHVSGNGIRIEDNPLSDTSVKVWIPQLREKEIRVYH